MTGPPTTPIGAPVFPNAACKGDGTLDSARRQLDLFFGLPGERPTASLARETEAKAICRRCPHLTECRAWALDNPGPIGDAYAKDGVGQIIGGLNSRERWTRRRAPRQRSA